MIFGIIDAMISKHMKGYVIRTTIHLDFMINILCVYGMFIFGQQFYDKCCIYCHNCFSNWLSNYVTKYNINIIQNQTNQPNNIIVQSASDLQSTF